MPKLKTLFEKIQIGNTELPNRILSTAHQTNHVKDGIPTSAMTAYHEARAKGGVGLIIIEAAAVHESGMLTTHTIAGYDENVVAAYADVANKVHSYGTKIFVQLFHGGREVVSSDYRNAALAPSAEPSLRFGTMPRPMNHGEIEEIINGFARSAELAKLAGLDGVEICCSHGYLPAQFWSNHVNHRSDEYGGSFENRMRFIVNVIRRVWEAVGEDFTVGIRMSSDEKTIDGTTITDAVEIVQYLVDQVRVDFINVTAGDSSSYSGSTHIVPPSPIEHGYLAADGFKLRMAGATPVFIGSRILDPVEAERIVSTGKADVVGMTRALIVDPDMPVKAQDGDMQTINYCLGCLQACIGHYHLNLPIGCVQNPMAGKEEEIMPIIKQEKEKRRVLVIGAGPAGLHASLTAAGRGHQVTLVDQAKSVGGLLNAMRRAPMRKELAETMIDNYSRQLAQSKVNVQLERYMTADEAAAGEYDIVISAVGSRPYFPQVDGLDNPNVIHVDELFSSTVREIGQRVIIFDYFGDWQGAEAAISLASKGHQVSLVSAKLYAGEAVHQFVRNEYLKRLYTLKVTLLPHRQFGGIHNGIVSMSNLFSHEVEHVTDWDTVVLSAGRVANIELYEAIKGRGHSVSQIGDCLAPRTLEEATYEGFMVGLQI